MSVLKVGMHMHSLFDRWKKTMEIIERYGEQKLKASTKKNRKNKRNGQNGQDQSRVNRKRIETKRERE